MGGLENVGRKREAQSNGIREWEKKGATGGDKNMDVEELGA